MLNYTPEFRINVQLRGEMWLLIVLCLMKQSQLHLYKYNLKYLTYILWDINRMSKKKTSESLGKFMEFIYYLPKNLSLKTISSLVLIICMFVFFIRI